MSLKQSLICCSLVLAVSQPSFAKKIMPLEYSAPSISSPKPLEHLIAKKQKLKTLTVPQLKAEVAKLTIHYNDQHAIIQDLVNEIANKQTTLQKNLEEQASLLNNVIAHNQTCIDSLQQEVDEHMSNPYQHPVERREPPFPGCPYCG